MIRLCQSIHPPHQPIQYEFLTLDFVFVILGGRTRILWTTRTRCVLLPPFIHKLSPFLFTRLLNKNVISLQHFWKTVSNIISLLNKNLSPFNIISHLYKKVISLQHDLPSILFPFYAKSYLPFKQKIISLQHYRYLLFIQKVISFQHYLYLYKKLITLHKKNYLPYSITFSLHK